MLRYPPSSTTVFWEKDPSGAAISGNRSSAISTRSSNWRKRPSLTTGSIHETVMTRERVLRDRARLRSSRRVRLAIVETAAYGGLLHYSAQLGDAVAERGHEVDLLTPRDNELVDRA